MKARSPKGFFTALFLVSLFNIAFELSLTRFFSIRNGAVYGYWIISIVMVGYAFSGVVVSMARVFFERNRHRLITFIPPLLIAVTVVSYLLTQTVHFNPFELQHDQLIVKQMLNILLYYAYVFPIYFLIGIYVNLIFIHHYQEISRLYAWNLIGSAAGSLLLLALMFCMSPFYLVMTLLPFLAVAAMFSVAEPYRRLRVVLAGAVILLLIGGEWSLYKFISTDFPQHKPIFWALNVKDTIHHGSIYSAEGYYIGLENFNERHDIDLSNNYSTIGVSGPPKAIGLYRDGERVTAVPLARPSDLSYVHAALTSFGYEIRHARRALLMGTTGGFRVFEAFELGASDVTALEPDRNVWRMSAREVKRDEPGKTLRYVQQSPLAYLAESDSTYDVMDLAPGLLRQSDCNRYLFTREALATYTRHLNDRGILILSFPIEEYSIYAVKLMTTVAAAVPVTGASRPGDHVMVYRSAWSVAILISNAGFTSDEIGRLKSYCDERSFDIAYFPGFDPARDVTTLWNELPVVSFENDATESSDSGGTDEIRDYALKVFRDGDLLKHHFFNLDPVTQNRPYVYSTLRPSRFRTLVSRFAQIPQQEIGSIINVGIVLQSALLALLVILLPLLRKKSTQVGGGTVIRTWIYFGAIGLAFLFIEIFMIEKLTLLFSNDTLSFAIVLVGLLVFSGMGSFLSGKIRFRGRSALLPALVIIGCTVGIALLTANGMIQILLSCSMTVKVIAGIAAMAPVAIAMGMFFPLGLSRLGSDTHYLLPWAWAINGAFSVISTPLANILSLTYGTPLIMLAAGGLYLLAWAAYPITPNPVEAAT